jgi:adenosine deaminase
MRRLLAAVTLLAIAACAPSLQRPARSGADAGGIEAATARHFETIRSSAPELIAFLRAMPKGADLHSHLSGTVYAETYIAWAAEQGLCVHRVRLAIQACAADPQVTPAADALVDGVLYRRLVDSMSMRNWELSGLSGHGQFFDAFSKFGPGRGTGAMIAQALSRAADGNVSYVELMLTPDRISRQLGDRAGWDGDFVSTARKLQEAGLWRARDEGVATYLDAIREKDAILRCGTADADPGCGVTVRLIAQVGRQGSPGAVFAQMITGLTLASDPSSGFVALNLVQGEDGYAAMANFDLHMQMLRFLRPLYPQAKLTLHAGELAWGLVPPEGLRSHIRDSVLIAGADRIGHGVDIMHEDDPYGLLREMARRKVLVEICLSSNDLILGVKGRDHPLLTYMKYGVPVALATDDEGVARSEMTREYTKAVLEHGLGYRDLKRMARASLEHAFIGEPDKSRLLGALDAAFTAFERRYR